MFLCPVSPSSFLSLISKCVTFHLVHIAYSPSSNSSDMVHIRDGGVPYCAVLSPPILLILANFYSASVLSLCYTRTLIHTPSLAFSTSSHKRIRKAPPPRSKSLYTSPRQLMMSTSLVCPFIPFPPHLLFGTRVMASSSAIPRGTLMIAYICTHTYITLARHGIVAIFVSPYELSNFLLL